MSEYFATVSFNGDKIEATRENTTVYTHHGTNEVYDHVFVKHDNGEYGGYIWSQQPPDNPAYNELAAVAVNNGCETHLNIQSPAECDIKAFGKAALKDLDVMPDWMPNV